MASKSACGCWTVFLLCLIRLTFSYDELPCCANGWILDLKKQKCVVPFTEFVIETYDKEKDETAPLIQCSHGWANFTINITHPNSAILEPQFNYTLMNGEYCMQYSLVGDKNANETAIAYCLPAPLEVKKCCPFGYALNRTSVGECVPSEQQLNISAYVIPPSWPLSVKPNASIICEYDYNIFLPEVYVDHVFNVLSTGELFLEASVYKLFRQSTHYCIDFAVSSAGYHEPVAVTCLPRRMYIVGRVLHRLYPFTQMFSAFLLFVTLLVYIVLPTLRNNLQGKAMICFLLSLFIVQVEYTILLTLPGEPHTWCSMKKHASIYFRCASSTWITVMGFVIWRQLKYLGRSNKQNECFEFLLASIYAWGLPLVWFFVMKSKIENPKDTHVCWIYNPTVRMWLQTPNVILVTLNLIFFIPNVIKVYGSLKFLRTAVTPVELSKLEKQRFLAICRFFLLMQLCAIHYSLPSIVNEIFDFNAAGPELLFYNACFTQFIGPAIFYFFIWKPEVWAMISTAVGEEPMKRIRLCILRQNISPRITFLTGRYQSYSTSELEIPNTVASSGCYRTMYNDATSQSSR